MDKKGTSLQKGMGIVLFSVILALLEAVLLPIATRNLVDLKDETTDTTGDQNDTIDDAIDLLFLLPIATVLVGVIAGFYLAVKTPGGK